MNVRIFVGDAPVSCVPADDRGIAYGDGLFETMRAHAGDAPWWDTHWARLRRGAERLHLSLPEEARVRAEARQLLEGGDHVLKLLVTRGSADRGYAPVADAAPTWMLSRHELPPPVPRGGIALRWCRTRLAVQPALAGLKHCNRLEQVLARAEWSDAIGLDRVADEGLMCSSEGDVVCATAANLFVLAAGRWITPPIDRCGVAGACRERIMAGLRAADMPAKETRLRVADVETADAVFLCNAVRGILPVARLGERIWQPHPRVDALREGLAAIHPGFASN